MITTNTGYKIYFGRGKFDDWCVFYNDTDDKKFIPLDKHYFQWILDLSKKYGVEQVYNDFLKVYDAADEIFDEDECISLCTEIDKNYEEGTTHWWVIYYMTMVAECKKENAILKKRIKHLGVYNVLFDGYDVDYVTKYMRGKGWRYLDKLMKERGIE